MQTRLKRPLLAAVVTGALFATGAVLSSPASASTPVLSDEPTATATATDEPTATVEPTATDTPAGDPTTDPAADPTIDPTTTAPTVDPTLDPTATPTDTPTGAPPTTTPPADVTPPRGSFKLNYSSLWVGQRTTLTLAGIADDHSAASAITRVVTWGDGTTSRLTPTQVTIAKQYTKAGRFPITVTLTDEAGNAQAIKSAGVAVTVPGKVKLSTTSVWHHQRFNVTFSSVPAGTTKIVVNGGDGYVATLKGKNQTVSKAYYHRYKGALLPAGPVTLTATYTNKQGTTTPIVIGKVTIKRDSWNPHVTVTKPSHSERVKSWKTIHGTATDKGSGVHDVIVVPMKASGNKVYCYTSKKKWLRLYNDTDLGRCGVIVGVSKGKWSLTLKGLTKGAFTVIAVGEDWSDRASNVAQRTKTLTHA
ncbi:MAG TPA: PKD domain-containing protein [Actinoplanes sp.]